MHSGEVGRVSLTKAIEPSLRQDGVSAPAIFGARLSPHQPLTLEAILVLLGVALEGRVANRAGSLGPSASILRSMDLQGLKLLTERP